MSARAGTRGRPPPGGPRPPPRPEQRSHAARVSEPVIAFQRVVESRAEIEETVDLRHAEAARLHKAQEFVFAPRIAVNALPHVEEIDFGRLGCPVAERQVFAERGPHVRREKFYLACAAGCLRPSRIDPETGRAPVDRCVAGDHRGRNGQITRHDRQSKTGSSDPADGGQAVERERRDQAQPPHRIERCVPVHPGHAELGHATNVEIAASRTPNATCRSRGRRRIRIASTASGITNRGIHSPVIVTSQRDGDGRGDDRCSRNPGPYPATQAINAATLRSAP